MAAHLFPGTTHLICSLVTMIGTRSGWIRKGAGTRIGTETRNDPPGQVSGHIAHER